MTTREFADGERMRFGDFDEFCEMFYDKSANALIIQVPTSGTSNTPVDAISIAAGGKVTYLGRGTVTQLTSKSTGVTLNNRAGAITMDGAALGAAAEATFTVTNSVVAANDVIIVNHRSAGTSGAYVVSVAAIASGSFDIVVSNVSAGSLSEAIVLAFLVFGTA